MEKQIWHSSYDSGVPSEISIPADSTLNDFVKEACAKYADRNAFGNFDSMLSFKDLDSKVEALAAYFQGIGLKKGDLIAIQLPNLLQTPIAIFAALRAGCIVVNTNPLYTSHEMLVQFKDSGVKAIVIFENFAYKLESIIKETAIEHVIVTGVGDLLGFPKGMFYNFVMKHVKKDIPAYNLEHTDFLRALSIGSKQALIPVDVKQSDTAFLQYTGGTTGTPKGAMLAHRNVIANILQIKEWFGELEFHKDDVFLIPLPIYHVFSLTCTLLTFYNFGSTNVFITNPKDIKYLLKQVARYRVRIMIGVSTLFRGMLSHKNFSRVDWERIDVIVSGGSSLDEPIARQFTADSKNVIIEGYGLSEASPIVCCNPFVNKENVILGTVGMPLPDTLLKFLDDDGNEVPFGQTGEIAVRGPQVMQGYWKKDEETRNVLKDGWLLTGDIGCLNEKGYLTIVNRKKDIIYVSGFNVYPSEIEAIISKHPSVEECVVIGIKDEKSGERPMAFVVPKHGVDVTQDEIKQYCAQYLTRYKIPKQVFFKSSLPKNVLGKVLRNQMHTLME